MATSSRSRATWTLAIALLALLAAKTWWGDVYHVDSGSMEPTILGGESVFVRYDRSPPPRFALVVLQRPGEEAPLVKRVVALGGERVEVRLGDLVIDGARLAPDAPRPPPIALWDQRWHSVEGSFRTGSTDGDPWSRDGDAWVVDARGVAKDADAAMAFWTGDLDDGWLAPDHARIAGAVEVADAILSCEVECRDPEGRVRLSLIEQGDLFEARIAFDAGRARATLVRRNRDPEQELAAAELDWPLGARRSLRFANVDNALTLAVDGAPLLVATYLENQFHPSDPAKLGKSFGDRVRLGAEGARVGFRAVRIERDLHYTARGTHAVAEALELDPGECFVLGDHSGQSRDGREWGPVSLAEVVGRPSAVVWPLARWRSLSTFAVASGVPAGSAGGDRAAAQLPGGAAGR